MSLSLFQRLAEESPEQQSAFLRRLPVEMQAELPTMPWWLMSRPEQQEPAGGWRFWLIMAGRGFGKTRTGAETIVKWARRYPGARIALVAITFGDGRDTMVEGEAGLLSVLKPSELRGGRQESAWNRSLGELFMANGTHFKIYSSEKPRQIRGPQFHFAWGDEPSYWADVAKGTAKDSTFSNLNFALRLPPRRDWDAAFRPRAIFTCTPRRVPLLKMPDDMVAEQPHLAGLTQRPDVVMTRGSTMDNLHNLDADYKAAVVTPMIGTTLGRQELGGELLEDVEGALWMQSVIDRDRVVSLEAVEVHRSVVAMDPSGGSGIGHDEHGIIGMGYAGHRRDPHFYVTHDHSLNGTRRRPRAPRSCSTTRSAPRPWSMRRTKAASGSRPSSSRPGRTCAPRARSTRRCRTLPRSSPRRASGPAPSRSPRCRCRSGCTWSARSRCWRRSSPPGCPMRPRTARTASTRSCGPLPTCGSRGQVSPRSRRLRPASDAAGARASPPRGCLSRSVPEPRGEHPVLRCPTWEPPGRVAARSNVNSLAASCVT
jgi:phage terminase large subunit-like protein